MKNNFMIAVAIAGAIMLGFAGGVFFATHETLRTVADNNYILPRSQFDMTLLVTTNDAPTRMCF